jgi:ATP-dependent DNA ligase
MWHLPHHCGDVSTFPCGSSEGHVAVEFEHADFDGVIPEGEYGAGIVMVWDTGSWVPEDTDVDQAPGGRLLFFRYEVTSHSLTATRDYPRKPRNDAEV